MPNGAAAAVAEATRLDEIGFPEFTAKLVTDVFDALVSANIRQTEAYIELIGAVAKSLKDYINDTKDDIGGELIFQFLAKVLPAGPEAENPTTVVPDNQGNVALNQADAETLNAAVQLPAEAEVANDNQVVANPQPNQDVPYQDILDAVARRLSANKYDLLKEMVKQGILRLVIENGLIETRLTFTTYGSSVYQANSSKYHRDDFRVRAKAKTGGALSAWVKASGSTSYSSVNIRTSKEAHRDVTGSRVQIFGRVRIEFKTDYLPLPG